MKAFLLEIITALYEMATFKSVTYYDRWFEISLSVMFWLCLILLIFLMWGLI